MKGIGVRTQKAIQMIKDGYTAKEITKALGFSGYNTVYNIASENGLKIAKATKHREATAKSMRENGSPCEEIAEALGMTPTAVSQMLHRIGAFDADLNARTCECQQCGKEFTPSSRNKNQKYCGIECQRKAGRLKLIAESETDDARGQHYMEEHSKRWEYVSGYKNSEGHLIARCKTCGCEKEFAAVSFRGESEPACIECERIKRTEQLAKERLIRIEVKKFNRVPKPIKVQTFGICQHCGGFYFGRGSFCSDECKRASRNHYYSLKSDKRRFKARTKESKNISVGSLYERDGGVCWICGGLCDINADTNSNEYPSIDHVVPVSLGGKDEWSNVKLAHRICNSRRGNRVITGAEYSPAFSKE